MASSSRSCKYDVFLSFRGEDTRKTFVDHLYSALKQHLIRVYKDDEALPRGESIGQFLFKAIEESHIAIVVLSQNYANSSWCLEELAHIMKCRNERGLIVIPIFYDVEPTEVRNLKRKFGEAFAKQEAKNVTKAEIWRKALVDVSNIAGWEPKNIADGHESQFIKKIADTILDRLFALDTRADEDLVGMRARFHDLESLLDIGSGDVRMVGIWGVGGGGKTTLATSIYMEIFEQFEGCSIVENVRGGKHCLNKLQENMLTALFQKKVEVRSVVEGKHMMKSMLRHRKVLVLLDDVDKLDQLEALAGKHNWFGSGSRIIITTRDEHLLRTHKVNHIYPITLLSHDEAIQLCKRHAYNEEDPVEDYETLSLRVVSYAAGLPLAIKVLGSFLYDKSKNEWISALNKLKDIADLEVMDILKVSYDGLETYQKELFLDIACFLRGKSKDCAMEMLEACGYHPTIGIKVLIQKALISIVDGEFEMHDLIQEMGHYIVRGEYPKNPEKHSRLWKLQDIEDISFRDEVMENDDTEAIIIKDSDSRPMNIVSSGVSKMVSKMKKLRLLIVSVSHDDYNVENDEGANFLSNELQYIDWFAYPPSPFPQSFQPVKLVVLKLSGSMQKELWKGCKHLPYLKVLQLYDMWNLLITPNFDGHLRKLNLNNCKELEEIHPSLRNHSSLEYLLISKCPKLKRLPLTSQMKNIKALIIKRCYLTEGDIPCSIVELSNLQELDLRHNSFSRLPSLLQLTRLKVLDLSFCDELLELPELPSSLAILTAYSCKSLTVAKDFYKNCKELCQVILMDYGWSDGLLQFMLKGNLVENGYMLLKLEGLEIPKGFRPPLLRGSRCRLELPQNWCDELSGFLMCFVLSKVSYMMLMDIWITMKQVSGMDSENAVVWEESENENDKYMTWVCYVPFGSLSHTAWWDPTSSAVSFNMETPSINYIHHCRIGTGVRLVEKKSRNGRTEISASSSHYTPNFKILYDSTSTLTLSLSLYRSK